MEHELKNLGKVTLLEMMAARRKSVYKGRGGRGDLFLLGDLAEAYLDTHHAERGYGDMETGTASILLAAMCKQRDYDHNTEVVEELAEGLVYAIYQRAVDDCAAMLGLNANVARKVFGDTLASRETPGAVLMHALCNWTESAQNVPAIRNAKLQAAIDGWYDPSRDTDGGA